MTAPVHWYSHIRIDNHPRHQFFLRESYMIAKRASDDCITEVGAVIVRDVGYAFRLIARGANGVSQADFEGTAEELTAKLADREWKMQHMTHAEKSALAYAKMVNANVRGATMYMPWIPCKPCAEEIVSAGITTLVSHIDLVQKTPERWHDSCSKALDYLAQRQVDCVGYEGSIGGVFHTFNGTVWTP
jgi:dCMP deaminase